jgi:phage-related holin
MKKVEKKAVKDNDSKQGWLDIVEKVAIILLTAIEAARFILDFVINK